MQNIQHVNYLDYKFRFSSRNQDDSWMLGNTGKHYDHRRHSSLGEASVCSLRGMRCLFLVGPDRHRDTHSSPRRPAGARITSALYISQLTSLSSLGKRPNFCHPGDGWEEETGSRSSQQEKRALPHPRPSVQSVIQTT